MKLQSDSICLLQLLMEAALRYHVDLDNSLASHFTSMSDKVLSLVKESRRTNSATVKLLQYVQGIIEDEPKKRTYVQANCTCCSHSVL